MKQLSNLIIIKSEQQGAAIVEFAIVAMLFFILLFGIFELGRLFYVFNSVQEVTRRAAREAVVRWAPDNEATIKQFALFGGKYLPGGAIINADAIEIDYLNPDMGESKPLPTSALDNTEKCLIASASCIAFVRVYVNGVTYKPIIGIFSGITITVFPFTKDNPFRIDLKIPVPPSTVTMPAESMGYTG